MAGHFNQGLTVIALPREDGAYDLTLRQVGAGMVYTDMKNPDGTKRVSGRQDGHSNLKQYIIQLPMMAPTPKLASTVIIPIS